jgi:hypothetical protein
MSYLSPIGFIMGGNGFETLWETVDAAGSVIHMMTGHAYARAVRAHSSPNLICIAIFAAFES